MTSIISTEDGRQYNKPGFMNNAGAVLAGSAVSSAIGLAHVPITANEINKVRKINLCTDTVTIRNSLDKALELSKMKDAGVKIIEPERLRTLKLNKFIRTFLDASVPAIGIPRNRNAGFNMLNNEIYLRKGQMATAGFHEIGHAINKNSSKFWKAMQILRLPGQIITGVILLTALFKRKKADGEEPKDVFDKSTTFVKNNAGKLTLLVSAPMLAEELKASARGNELAKQVLSPELYKKVLKTNKYSAIIYASGFVLTGLAAYLASKVRDAIAKPKEIQPKN